jgi:outer membrane autotransporter protein
LTGGLGGNAKAASAASGQGGFGGEGVWISNGGSLVNNSGGMIAGGASASLNGTRFDAPAGGVGIVGTNATVINAGTITGGKNAAGTNADAIQFIGGVNSLEIRAGSTITGNVVAFSTADTLKLGGAGDSNLDVSAIGAGAKYQGFGQYQKTGSSTWTLMGTSTAAMPWTVQQGTLAVDGSMANSSFAVDAGSALTVGGTVADSSITANGGTVAVAAGGSVASSPFTVNAGSTLTVDGTIDGSPVTVNGGTVGVGGSATKSPFMVNTGALTVSGTVGNSPITLNGSTAVVAAGGSIANSPFMVNTGSTLTVNGAIADSAVTVNAGMAAVAMGGSASNSPFTVNNGGMLAVDGSAATSSVVINNGGTLRGNGTVGATTVHAGGLIAPGHSIGTLNVNGNYVQEKEAVYQAEIDPMSGASDRIAMTGAATLQDGAVLNVIKTTPAPYVVGAKYTVLTATDGVNGAFTVTGDTNLTPFLALSTTYDPSNAYLEVKQTQSIGSVATTPNQAATASGLDSVGVGSAAAAPVLNQPSVDAARAVLDQLSGEIHASVQTAMVENSHFTRDAISDRLADTYTCPTDAATDGVTTASGRQKGATRCGTAAGRQIGWARFYGNWGHTDGDGNASRLNRSVGGFFIGADMPVSDAWRVGVLTGYSHGTYDVSGSNASASSDDYHLGVYGGAQWGALGFRSGVTYTWHDISADRHMAAAGFSDHLSSNYNAGTTQAFGELGYKMGLGSRSSIEPFLNLAYVNQHADGFTESGGADALHVGSQDMDTGFSTLGLRGTTHFTFNGTDFLLKGMVGWRYAVGDVTPVASESFQGGTSFDISGVPIARNQAVVDLGVGVHITRNATISLSYNGQFASHATDQGVLGALNIAF